MHRQYDGWERGGALDEAGMREIVSDGRGRSAQAVADFLRSEFLVSPDAVWMRYRPSAVHDDPRRYDGGRVVAVHNPVLSVSADAAVNPWRLATGERSWEGDPPGAEAVSRLLEAIPAGDGAGDVHDLVRLANWLAVKTRPYVEARPSSSLGFLVRAGERAASVEAAGRLRTYEDRGALGGIGADEAPEVLGLAADALEAFAASIATTRSPELGALGRTAGYLRRVALPRLAARRDRELMSDMDGLSLLGPTP